MSGPRHLIALLGLALPGIALASGLALAAQTVQVSLTENSAGHMMISTSVERVRAGKVTFAVTNKSHDIEYEFLVAPLHGTPQKLPYDEARSGVKEAALKGVKELGDLPPGKAGTITLNLKPGKYLLFCNLPGHFKAGMYHVLTVTK